MEEKWISPKYTSDVLRNSSGIDQKIDVYEDQIWGWFLDIADKLKDDVAADFVILLIIFSLIEGHVIYLKGEDSIGKSKVFFREGFKKIIRPIIRVNPSMSERQKTELLSNIAEVMYEQARCGLFHDGLTRYGIEISRGHADNPPAPIMVDYVEHNAEPFRILIDVPKLLDVTRAYFNGYFSELRNPENEKLRKTFVRGWKILHEDMLSEGGRKRFGVLFRTGVVRYYEVKNSKS